MRFFNIHKIALDPEGIDSSTEEDSSIWNHDYIFSTRLHDDTVVVYNITTVFLLVFWGEGEDEIKNK